MGGLTLALARRRMPQAFAVATALVVASLLRTDPVLMAASTPYVLAAIEQWTNWVVLCVLLVIVISACEVALQGVRMRTAVQAVAVVATAVFHANFIGTSPWLTRQYVALGLSDLDGLFAYILWFGLTIGALLSWYYAAYERVRHAARALQEADAGRQRTEQQLLESRLQVVEAQVEPRFLLATLSRIQSLYERDAVGAERTLDDLVAYLRAALPQLREHASTIGREMDLVDAYVRIVCRQPPPITPLASGMAQAYAPPMVLLPAVQLALTATTDSDAHSPAIRASKEGSSIVVRIEFDVSPGWNNAEGIEALHSTIKLLFAGTGGVALAMDGSRATLTASWPHREPSAAVPLSLATAA
jgi:hypothetical protein